MKKFLFVIMTLTALSVSIFTGCGEKGSTSGDRVADTANAVPEETQPEEENKGTGFEYMPKVLNGKAVTSETDTDETAPDGEEKPNPEKCKRHRRRHRTHDGELFIIHFERILQDDDMFKPHLPPKPDIPEDPEEPIESENGEN